MSGERIPRGMLLEDAMGGRGGIMLPISLTVLALLSPLGMVVPLLSGPRNGLNSPAIAVWASNRQAMAIHIFFMLVVVRSPWRPSRSPLLFLGAGRLVSFLFSRS